MQWHRIVVNNIEPLVADVAVRALGEIFKTAKSLAKASLDFEVWHLRMSAANHIYCLSPKACEFALPVLNALLPEKQYNVQLCTDKPDLTGFSKLPL